MAPKYKVRNMLKNLPFYSEEIKSSKNKNKKFSNIRLLYELAFFQKETKKLTNKQLLEALPFPLKKPRKLKKYQILKYILPFYDTVRISRRERAYKRYMETYNVEVVDKISLSDSLFLVKSKIVDLFKDLLKEKRDFKYNLMTKITLKLWNNATNTSDINTVYFDSGPITVISQRLNLKRAYELLKHRLDIWSERGSGWIVYKIEDIKIKGAVTDLDILQRASSLRVKFTRKILGWYDK